MTVYLFPGQGSQAKGMGKELLSQFPQLIDEADDILGYSIASLLTDDPQQQLNQTQYTQPALYVTNALMYCHKNNKPDYVVGHSLGEYSALFAAEVFDFATGLKLVKKRGELMSQAQQGGMAAVIGLPAESIQSLLEKNNLHHVSIANYNSYTQIVISGMNTEVTTAQALCEKAGAKMVVPLKVSGAFHSPLMKEAQQEFEKFIGDIDFSLPVIPVISNVTAKPYNIKEIKQMLSRQIASPVRWAESMEYLLAMGEDDFEEIGPGNILTGLIKRIRARE